MTVFKELRKVMAESGGFEPPVQLSPYNGLANRRLQPLGQLSSGVARYLTFIIAQCSSPRDCAAKPKGALFPSPALAGYPASMTTAELLLQDYDIEISNTRRTLERVPEDKPDWAPHPKSMKLGKLAMHCATIPLFGYYILEDEGMDLANSTRPHADLTFHSSAECLARLDESAAMCREAIAAASDDHLAAMWKFSFGEHVIAHHPRSMTFRTMCFDHMIHHVAQLGVYLRLNDLPVPALYGPSADEQWAAK
jgi:uncharacterized damage-inducible protein DinB